MNPVLQVLSWSLGVIWVVVFGLVVVYRHCRKTIPEGGDYPKGYGVAWDDFDKKLMQTRVICYPVPLNIIIGLAMKLYTKLRRNLWFRNNAWFNFCLSLYDKGVADGIESQDEGGKRLYQEGLREGYARCRMVVCPHLRPPGKGDPNTKKRMGALAQSERRFDTRWGVVNPSNALVLSTHDTKTEAEVEKLGAAYVVVRVAVTPLYEHTGPPGVPG